MAAGRPASQLCTLDRFTQPKLWEFHFCVVMEAYNGSLNKFSTLAASARICSYESKKFGNIQR